MIKCGNWISFSYCLPSVIQWWNLRLSTGSNLKFWLRAWNILDNFGFYDSCLITRHSWSPQQLLICFDSLSQLLTLPTFRLVWCRKRWVCTVAPHKKKNTKTAKATGKVFTVGCFICVWEINENSRSCQRFHSQMFVCVSVFWARAR